MSAIAATTDFSVGDTSVTRKALHRRIVNCRKQSRTAKAVKCSTGRCRFLTTCHLFIRVLMHEPLADGAFQT